MEDERKMTQSVRKQNPLLFYLQMLLYMILALVIRVITFAPLACLFVFEATSPLKWLALLCPALLIFVVLPLRYSFAEAVVGTSSFRFDKAFGFGHYGEKLTESLKHALHVIKWGLPLAALGVYAYYLYNEVDALTLLTSVTEIGKGWNSLYCGVANFFIGIFGGEALVPSANTMMDGLLVVLAVIALVVLVWIYGAVRNSASRYIWVLATRLDRDPKTETRRRLIGRRWGQFGIAVINFILWIPFIAVTAMILKNTVSDLSTVVMMAVATGSLPEIDLASSVMPLVGCFAGLYLTLLPVRRWLTFAYAVRERKSAAKKEAA